MAILVDFYAGNGESITRAFRADDFDALASFGKRSVGFKFTLSPAEAIDPLIRIAADIRGVHAFPFDSCLAERETPTDEAFASVLDDRFPKLFAGIPKESIGALADRWTDELCALHPPSQSGPVRSLPWHRRIGGALGRAMFTIILLPIIGIAMLNPAFRRERAANRAKLENRQPVRVPSNAELLEKLIELCKESREHSEDIVFSWSI